MNSLSRFIFLESVIHIFAMTTSNPNKDCTGSIFVLHSVPNFHLEISRVAFKQS